MSNSKRLEFHAYQLSGTDLFRNPELTDRLSEFHDLERGMTVYSTGMMGELLEIKVERVDGALWSGRSQVFVCSGSWQPYRYAEVADDDVGGWAMEVAGHAAGLARANFA